ncbi:MAG: hypothetical protein FNP40_08310 [Dehalobacter sp. 4CP]|nr:hypothetical protein [Dehalobacter sp. 4CP]
MGSIPITRSKENKILRNRAGFSIYEGDGNRTGGIENAPYGSIFPTRRDSEQLAAPPICEAERFPSPAELRYEVVNKSEENYQKDNLSRFCQ